jgi:hypothetical protein
LFREQHLQQTFEPGLEVFLDGIEQMLTRRGRSEGG